MANVELCIVDEEQFIESLGSKIELIGNSCIKEKDSFHVGVSGGSLVKFLEKCLPNIRTDWNKWLIFFCDERIVPFDDQESTYGLYKNAFHSVIPLTDEQFIKINPHLSAEKAAEDYGEKLKLHFGNSLPRFDLLLLGMGPDGHTCSLFPAHPLLDEKNLWVAPITDSPKPPPSRITLTYPIINNAKICLFALSGKAKADILKRVLKDKEDLPATRVKPTSGKVTWLLDREASALL